MSKPMKWAPSRGLTIVAGLAAVLLSAAGASPPTGAFPAASVADTLPVAVRARHGMVVSATEFGSRVGMEVLRAGGNAVDAAIATGFALAVTYPTAGNIGGGGFMVIRFPDGTATALDFREKAPQAAHPRMFLDEDGEYSPDMHHRSHLSVGVPGTVAGFAVAHERYGRLAWSDLVAPAVRLARDGFPVMPGLAESLNSVLPRMEPYPSSIAAFSMDGMPYEVGDTLKQPDLARTLDRIMRQGRDGFYKGETARLIADEMRRGGGIITEGDLARYEVEERVPVHGTYRGYDIISMPPPSSGGVALIEMLNVLEGYDLRAMGHNSAEYVHYLTEAMRRAYRDRARFLADPAYADVPVEQLTSKDYAKDLRAAIDPWHATPSAATDIDLPYESPQTTHYSVVDADGMAVSVTYTLEDGYGSKVVVPGAGFLLNNEMGDFNAKPGQTDTTGLIGTAPNQARPGQRMLSSMTPSILAKDGALVGIVGSPGGRTIINSVLQVVLNVVDFDMDIQQAVNAKRLHHQWLPDVIRIESDGVPESVARELRSMGYRVEVRGEQGRTNCIMIDPATGERLGAADSRDPDAAAVGY